MTITRRVQPYLAVAAGILLCTLSVRAQDKHGKVRIIQTNAAGDNVHVIDPATNKVVGVIDGIEVSHGAAVAPDGSRIYVSNEADSTLDFVDGKSLKVIKKVPLSGHPNNIAIGKDGRRVYVGIIQAPGGVDVIDTVTMQNLKTLPTKGTIHNAYVTPDGKYVVAGSIAGKTINVFDAKTDESAWVLDMDLGIRPMAFAANPDGSTKWIFAQLTALNGFAVIDFATRKEIKRIQNPDLPPGKATVPEGSDPSHGMAVTADGKTLVVCSRLNNYLYSYSLPDLKVLGGAELSGKGAGLGDAHARRQDGLRGEPGDQRRLGRRHQDDERSDENSGRVRPEAQHHRHSAVIMTRHVWILAVLLSGALMAAQETLVPPGGMASLRRRPWRNEVLGVDGRQRRERAAAADRLAVEALGNAARRIQNLAGVLRKHAPDDRRCAVRDDAVQQHRGA